MSKIANVEAFEVLDSRGNPTVAVELTSATGVLVQAIVPSGASTGEHEACELRDGDSNRYLGKGVLKAVAHVNQNIKAKITGFTLHEQREFDELLINLDGMPNKSKLGANAILGVSMAYTKLSAAQNGTPLFRHFAQLSGQSGTVLPVPMMNILNGGAHADNNLDMQEVMIVPHGFYTFSEALRAGAEVFHHLKKILHAKKMNTAVGDEGGFAPDVKSNAEALALVSAAVTAAGYKLGAQIALALDVAASEFFKEGVYVMANEAKSQKSVADMIQFYQTLTSEYPIVSIEDGLDQNDWHGWQQLTQALGAKTQLVGDDLFVTNSALLEKGIDQNVANAILIKVNQIGTITETLDCIALAKKAGYNTVISHRSGETEDTLIADLAVGVNAGQIKTGSLCRTDRVAKYNRLLRIDAHLASAAKYGDETLRKRLKK